MLLHDLTEPQATQLYASDHLAHACALLHFAFMDLLAETTYSDEA